MPVDLRKAHQINDKAVMEAYDFLGKVKSEADCVARLMEPYKKLTEDEDTDDSVSSKHRTNRQKK